MDILGDSCISKKDEATWREYRKHDEGENIKKEKLIYTQEKPMQGSPPYNYEEMEVLADSCISNKDENAWAEYRIRKRENLPRL